MTGAAGYPLTGLLGGLVSSTSVTLTFARLSKSHPKQDGPLATGAVAASTVLFLRVAVPWRCWTRRSYRCSHDTWRRRFHERGGAPRRVAIASRREGGTDQAEKPAAAARRHRDGGAVSDRVVRGALRSELHWRRRAARQRVCAGVDGCGCVDALDDTQRVKRNPVDAAARAITIGIVANSLMKAGIAVVVGSGRFRWQAGAALLAMAAAGTGALSSCDGRQNSYSIVEIRPRQYGSGPCDPIHATSQYWGTRMPDRSTCSRQEMIHGCSV